MSTGFLQHTGYWRNYRVENTLAPPLPIRTGDEQVTKEAENRPTHVKVLGRGSG